MNICDMYIQEAQRQVTRARSGFTREIARRNLIRALTYALVDRDGPQCRYCGVVTHNEKEPIYSRRTFDHVVPVSAGGKDELRNGVVACHNCNSRKGSRAVQSFAQGEH